MLGGLHSRQAARTTVRKAGSAPARRYQNPRGLLAEAALPGAYDLNGVVTRGQERRAFLEALNRLRPDVVLELRRVTADRDECRAEALAWAKRWNLTADWLMFWSSLAIQNWQTLRALDPQSSDRYTRWDAER